MTLKELLNQIENTEGKRTPTAKGLRESGIEIVVQKEINTDCLLSVYANGFAIYQTPEGATVFRADYCGGYTYFGRKQETAFDEEYFAGKDWWVRLYLEGEDRLTHNRNVQAERYECSYENELAEDMDISLQHDYLVREALARAFELMTQREREVVRYFFIEGMTGKEIAEIYGVSQQSISRSISAVRKRLQKNKKLLMEAL